MITAITLKSDGSTLKPEQTGAIALNAPSVVTLNIGPETVARFDKVGNDLVLVLKDGRKVTIADFFVMYGEERSDVVFIDENGVTWWGQYSEPWTDFQIAEIEAGTPPAAFGFAGLLPALALLGGGAAIAAGGGGGGEPAIPTLPEREPVSVVEGDEGFRSDEETPDENLLNGLEGGPEGNKVSEITYKDRDGKPQTDEVPERGLTVETQYGELTVNPDGSWSFTPVKSADHKKPGNDDDLSDDFTFKTTDDDGKVNGQGTQKIVVEDTEPDIGTPEDGIVDEAGLRDPDSGPVNVGGSLDVTPGADEIDTIVLSGPDGLTSGGVDLKYVFNEDEHTLTAYKGDPKDGDKVFTVTVTTPKSDDPGYEFELHKPLDHNKDDHDTDLDLTFNVEVTDSDGDTAEGDFSIKVIDDNPVANDDKNTIEAGTSGPAEGNVITGEGDGEDKADTVGADGAVVSKIQFGGNEAVILAGEEKEISGDYGVLTIKPDGTYSYERNPGTPGDKSDEFTYTLRDGDGDVDTATLTIDWDNAEPSIGGIHDDREPEGDLQGSDVVVDESKLSNGTGAGEGAATADSSFKVTAFDGIADLSISEGDDTVAIITNGKLADDPITLSSAFGTIEITGYDSESGVVSYTYTLENSAPHTAGRGEIFDAFKISLTDLDGDIATDETLNVRILDDVPVISKGGRLAALQTDEKDLAAEGQLSSATGDFSGLFGEIIFGADGEAKTDSTIYDLVLSSEGVDSGLVDTATGQRILLYNEDGKIIGRVDDGTDNYEALSVTVDADAGNVTFELMRPVEHGAPDSDTNEAISIAGDTIQLQVTATDGDGDKKSKSAEIGGLLVIKDDVPLMEETDGGRVYEAGLSFGTEPGEKDVEVSGNFDVKPGQDGIKDTLFTSDQEAPSGLKSGGEQLKYDTTDGGHTLIAYKKGSGEKVFTVTMTDPDSNTPGYNFELHRPLDHGSSADGELGLTFDVTVKDKDLDEDTGTLTITVKDDEREEGDIEETIKEDSEEGFTIQTSADVTVDRITFKQGDGDDLLKAQTVDGNSVYKTDHGTLTVTPDGIITYHPAENYSGTEEFEFTTTDEGAPKTTNVTMTVTPVSDAPDIGEKELEISTDEDVAKHLGLTAPVITDDGSGKGNNPLSERLGAITLEISGAGASGVTLDTGGKKLTPFEGKVTIVLTDADHINGMPDENPSRGIYRMTKAEYEALEANPFADSGKNFTVTVSATSYEVDDTGAKTAGVDGATSTQTIDVDVQAVTDGATLTSSADEGLTFAEDGTIDLSEYLTATLDSTDDNPGYDTDGSETYWYTVSGLPTGSVVTINGDDYTADDSGMVTSSASNVFTSKPAIAIKPAKDFSGDIEDVKITLHSQDTDDDSNHTPDTLTSEVELNLYVTPVAGDVSVDNVTTKEDTAVAFLAGVTVTDKDTGTEVINSVSFVVPDDWEITSPAENGFEWDYDPNDPNDRTAKITFDDTLTQTEREAVLKGFEITPPAHSSKDATIELSIKTTDKNTVDGEEKIDTQTTKHPLKITVTPVAERTDTDSDGENGNDVTMNGDHSYKDVAGEEDTWFALGTNYTDASNDSGGQDLKSPWSNEDPDEFTYAVLTPTLESDTAEDSVNGTQFRYSTDEGDTWVEQSFVGEPIWVPHQYLDTLQVKLPQDVAGTLTIGMQAGTVDYDDDAEVTDMPLDPPKTNIQGDASFNVAISGEAILSSIVFEPVADPVTMSVNGGASGLEDSDIPLSVTVTTSDPSETLDVTISGIQEGAIIKYGTGEDQITFTATKDNNSLSIKDFSNTEPLSIKPKPDSNDDFTLAVSAVSNDGIDMSAEETRTIDVSVTGVADEAVITKANDYSTTEETLDGDDNHRVALSNIVTSVASTDTDGSEVATLRITGLKEGFSVEGATLVKSDPGGTERVWVVAGDKLNEASIVVPENYSGTVKFKVAGVTTENDGDSLTGEPKNVSFTVTPSPEATITTSATLLEDKVSPLNLEIVHQNGDIDEYLGKIYIPEDYADNAKYTLYLGDEALHKSEFTPVSGVTGVPDGDYYVIPADQVGELGAMGADNMDGPLGSLDFRYEVIDPSNDGTLDRVSEIKQGTLELDATPETDPVVASITGIAMGTAQGTTEDLVTDDGAAPDTATVTEHGSFTVDLHVDSDDTDGSESVIRVLIEGVPDGVTVVDASPIGGGKWLLVYDKKTEANSIGTDGLKVPVEFVVGQGASNKQADITMTVQAQDRGNTDKAAKQIEKDSVSWKLNVALGSSGDPSTPPEIGKWEYNGASGKEDDPFKLGEVMGAEVSISDASQSHSYTVTITGLPADSTVTGMTLTIIDDVPTWTATKMVSAGGDSRAALDELLGEISITPPPNSNENNDSNFGFNAKLTASTEGGTSVEMDEEVAKMPVIPATDPAAITVTVDDIDEGTSSVTATIEVGTPIDGEYGKIVDGKLYVQVATTNNDEGTVTDGDDNVLTPTFVSNVTDVPAGDYYVIDVGEDGGSVDLTYTVAEDPGLEPGSVSFTAHAETHEVGADAADKVVTLKTGTAQVEIINNGVTVGSEKIDGDEVDTSDKAKAIELTGLSVDLIDDDGSESVRSILLSGVPVGFLLYVGDSAEDTKLAQASNAGGDGATNTWVVSEDGTMPEYIAIMPPKHWSGELSGLALVVESGENDLPTTKVESIALQPVTVKAVANGVTIAPTKSFGPEGSIIDLNLNASMADAIQSTAAGDDSTETTSLKITGLGEHAAFYVDGQLITSVSYDNDTYTITGLTQDQLSNLGFVQAASALTDQDEGSDGLQVKVEAWTVESGNNDESNVVEEMLTLAVTPTLATTGDDTLLWTGGEIDGLGGEDTVEFRNGENLTGEKLAEKLSNIEILDLGVAGANTVTELTADNVRDMTDARNELTIKGTDDDSVTLSGEWRDEGGNVYSSGSGHSKVTLTVVDGVEVDEPTASFLTSNAPASIMSFGGGISMFGLMSLDDPEARADSRPSDGSDDDTPLTLGAVLASDNSDDLSALLPDEDGGSQSSGGSATADPDAGGGGVMPPFTSWEDEQNEGMEYVS